MFLLVVELGDPASELGGVGDGGRQEDVVDLLGEQDERLLPDDAPLLVPQVVDLVKHNPLHLAHHLDMAKQGNDEFILKIKIKLKSSNIYIYR